MKKNKLIEFILSIILCIATLFSFFLPNAQLQKYVLTIFLVVYTIVIVKLLGLNKISNLGKKNLIILIFILSIMHVLLLYFIGIWTGFYRNLHRFNSTLFLDTILPYIIIVVCSEIIRQIFIEKRTKCNIVIVTIVLILVEMITYLSQYSFDTLNETLILVGYIFLPAIGINILSNYIVKRYGLIPNILYRIITIIYIYVFSVLPNIYMFFLSIYRILYSYLVFIIVDRFFEKNQFKKINKNNNNKLSLFLFSICVLLSVIFVMLISCKFYYGILVIGSSSMLGTIDKGDAVVFEQYKNQQLEKGDIIVFIKDNIKTVHCIENIQIKNNETIYYTKGTNNQQQDEGYRTDSDIIGIVKFKIILVGWPTIWFNDLFHH